jgi:predicted methyltransferase
MASASRARPWSFSGLRDDMRVLELIPSGGWYTKILASVLADKGELYVAIGTARAIEPMIRDVPALAKVKVAQTDAKFAPAAGQMGKFDLGDFSLGVKNLDLVLTFRNYHNPDTGSARQPQQSGVCGAEIRWYLWCG